MEFSNVIEGYNITKKYKGFTLDVPHLQIPKGFSTALVGENGAGKTTLLNILAGILLDCKGRITYFGKYSEKDRENVPDVKNKIGYVGPGTFFFPQWTVKNIEELYSLLFDNFHKDKFEAICSDLALFPDGRFDYGKKNSAFSDGNKMKLMLAGAFARDTEMLMFDEPASPLDPLMRDTLCQMIRNYLDEGNGERTAFYSTHNISDMESVTDYVIIVEHGQIVEEGFVEDLKEKYILVKGDVRDIEEAEKALFSISKNAYGFEGICLADDIDRLAGMDILKETPNLSQICVAVMKANTKLAMNIG